MQRIAAGYLPYWIVALTMCCLAHGCRSTQQMTSNNPFGNPLIGADRVPPPATRALPPGTAQPYYPGDPVPVLQGGAATPAPGFAAAPSANPAVVDVTAPGVRPAQAVQPVALNQVGAAGQFQGAASPPAVADTGFTQPALPAAASGAPQRLAPPPSGEPGSSVYTVAPAAWRSPGVGQGVEDRVPRQFDNVSAAQAIGTMQAGAAPRIRMPGGVQPASFAAPRGVPQTVAITELPPSQAAPIARRDASAWQVPPSGRPTTAHRPDGFRPRSTMR